MIYELNQAQLSFKFKISANQKLSHLLQWPMSNPYYRTRIQCSAEAFDPIPILSCDVSGFGSKCIMPLKAMIACQQ